MTIEDRVREGTLCDHCKNLELPLTESNSQHLFQRDWDEKKGTVANVHRECADAWVKANGGIITNDEPLPPRPAG